MPFCEQCEVEMSATHPAQTRANTDLAGSVGSVGGFYRPVRVCACARDKENKPSSSPLPFFMCAGADECGYESVSREGVFKLFTLFPKSGELIRTGLAAGWHSPSSASHPSQQEARGTLPTPYGSSQETCRHGMFEPRGCASGWLGNLLTGALTA